MAGKTTTQDPLPTEPLTSNPNKTRRALMNYYALDKVRELHKDIMTRPDVAGDPEKAENFFAALRSALNARVYQYLP